jgi:hypothetical protein
MRNFQQQMVKYDDYVPIYTDGSKIEECVGCSEVVWYKKMNSGIEGNEEADQEAKAAITLSHKSLFLTSEDAVAYVKKMSGTNKQHVPKDITRKEQVALARQRMGYPWETRGAGNSQPLCQTSDLPRTCQHIILHCTEYTTARLTTNLTNRYKHGDEPETFRLILFLRDTGLISKLYPTFYNQMTGEMTGLKKEPGFGNKIKSTSKKTGNSLIARN